MADAEITGLGHVALNVKDVARSVQWYGEVLGFTPVFSFDTDDFDRQIMIHASGAVVALSRHRHPDADVDFSERRTGLDHLAFNVRDATALEGWAARLDALGVPHSGVAVTPRTGSALLAFRDPDGIALELYVQVGPPEDL